MNVYEQIVEIDDELRIIYRIRGARKKIKIFNSDFVQAFKNKLKISYLNKDNKLKDEFDVKNINTDKIEIKLKGLKKINNLNELKGMLYGCESFLSIPNVSKWNKDKNINKINLFISNNINNKKDYNKLKITLTTISGRSGSGTGKTALIERFLNNTFIDKESISKIGVDKYSDSIIIDQLNINLIIYYTPVQERFWSMHQRNRDTSDGLIFIFDLRDISSFEDIKDRILKAKDENKNLESIICANKCDLGNERKIFTEDIKKLESEFNIKAFETSAKTGQNVKDAFEYLIRKIINKRK